MRLLRRTTILWVLALIGPALALAADFGGRVVGVTDGDTVTVLPSDRRETKVRLYGIDAPERGQPFGTRAKQLASDLAFGREVTVRVVDVDRYGRQVGVVILPDGTSVNEALVREGMAWWYQRYAPRDATLERLEAEARQAGRGLWSDKDPVPPWEWRKAKREGK